MNAVQRNMAMAMTVAATVTIVAAAIYYVGDRQDVLAIATPIANMRGTVAAAGHGFARTPFSSAHSLLIQDN